jgi:hypothetical protein
VGIGSAGTISNYRDKGIHIENSYTLKLQNVKLVGNGATTLDSAAVCGNVAAGTNTNCAANLDLQGVNTILVSDSLITGGAQIGLNARNVVNLDLVATEVTGAAEAGIQVSGFTSTGPGSNWLSLNVHDNGGTQMKVASSAGNASVNLTNSSFTHTAFQAAPGGHGLSLALTGTASVTLNATNLTFARTRSHAVQVTTAGNGASAFTLDGGTMADVGGLFDTTSSGSSPFHLVRFKNYSSAYVDAANASIPPINVAMSGATAGTTDVTISGNSFGNASIVGSAGPCPTCPTMEIRSNGTGGKQTVTVSNNTMVHSRNGFASIFTSASPDFGRMWVNMTGNNIGAADEPANNDYAVRVVSGLTAGDGSNTCTHMSGNTIGSGYATVANGGAIRLTNNFTTSILTIPGYGGTLTDTTAAAAYVSGNNGSAATVATLGAGASFAGTGAACF